MTPRQASGAKPKSSMLGIRTMFRCVLLICFLGTAGLAVAEPLTFDAALEIATRSSPDIAVQTASVEAAQSASVAAGRLPDPKLTVGVENAIGSDLCRQKRRNQGKRQSSESKRR